MVDATQRALALTPAQIAQGDHPRAALHALPPTCQLALRGPPDSALKAGAAFGPVPPVEPCRAAIQGDRAALWLGPDEWLLLASATHAKDVFRTLESALAGLPHALVNVGHRNVALQLTGPDAAIVLNAGCPLDLDATAFPQGMCTRTVLAKAQIILWRRAAEDFYISAWRSFAPYVWDYLVEARSRL